MSIKEEWRSRIDRWSKAMPPLFYQEAGDIEFTGFLTAEQLRPEQALAGDFKPMRPGTLWGMKWEYAWFKGSVTIPETLAGERVVAKLGVGTENVGGAESVTVIRTSSWPGKPRGARRSRSSPRPTPATGRWAWPAAAAHAPPGSTSSRTSPPRSAW